MFCDFVMWLEDDSVESVKDRRTEEREPEDSKKEVLTNVVIAPQGCIVSHWLLFLATNKERKEIK